MALIPWYWENSPDTNIHFSQYRCILSVRACLFSLTVCVLEGLFLLGGFGDDLDPLAEEDSDVRAVPVEHLHCQHEVLPLV